jgi:penicillin-binding protein 1A
VKKLRLALIVLGLTLLALVSTVFGMMMAVASDLPDLENRREYKGARNSVLVDVHRRPLGILTGRQNRILISGRRIAPAMKNAIVAVEDKRFNTNEGVDVRAIGRAFVADVMRRRAVQGGSTITQQFVKNALRAQNERTVFQKLREAALAYHLTRKWSKDKILTEYLNSIYFGNGAYGIESAARTYFGSDPNHLGCGTPARLCASELKPHEAALLAGVVASPSNYDPVSHPAAARARRNLVLSRMLEQGYIERYEYSRYIAEVLPAQSHVKPPRVNSVTPSAGYFTSWVEQQVVARYGAQQAFEGGLKIRTTLDLDFQRAAEQAVTNRLAYSGGPTASLVAIDNRTGEVRAMVGGRDYNKTPFNLATQGQRQPGSAFKPFVLAQALRSGISPGSVWPSRKRYFTVPNSGGKEQFVVNNYEDAYAGSSTLARATTYSDNAVYAAVGIKVGVDKIARLAQRMGIRTPVSRNYAITLGGLKEGVTPLDMAHAYQTIAREGRLVSGTLGAPDHGPVGIREVDRLVGRGEGEFPERNKPVVERVLPAGVAKTETELLETVIRSGTGRSAALEGFAAGKTGTTENYGDAWFVGFTERYTVAVWVGYPNRLRPMKTEYRGQPVAGGTFPAEIWRDFMVAVKVLDERRAAERAAKEGKPPPTATSTAPAPAVTTPTTTPTTPKAPPTPTRRPPAPAPRRQTIQPPSSDTPPTETTPAPNGGAEPTPGEPEEGGEGDGTGETEPAPAD